MSVADRIKQLRSNLGLTLEEFGKRAGVRKQAVNNWESGRSAPNGPASLRLAQTTGVSPRWLESGKGEMFAHQVQDREADYNVSPGPERMSAIPLISWVQAGAWQPVVDPYQPGDYEELVKVDGRYSNMAYALRVQGDSMQSSHGPSFPPGSIIICEPEAEARHGSFVVVRLEEDQEATFKQLVIDGGRQYLKPLNPQYPTMEVTSEATICGVVRQLVMRFD